MLCMPKPTSHPNQPILSNRRSIASRILSRLTFVEAVDLAFGPYAKYGTIIKEYRNATMT